MASSVHFKFKSQKEFSRVAFDGTGISVFELKREVINQSKLGDGVDFELAIYNAETGEEYEDDTALVPRTTRVLVRRLPASRPGKGGAARYVSGRMPINAKSNAKIESSAPGGNDAAPAPAPSAPAPQEIGSAQSEEDKIKALLNLQEDQWKVQQEEMANATPVMMGRGRGKPANVPDHPPPPGYVCYRCREKGHWIQACPTNDDPNFDGRYRVKRSTGIPRSLQKQVDRPDNAESVTEDSKVSGVMVNADGDFVIAQPDKASWELYQEKAKAAAAAASEAAAVESSKEVEARGLQCPIDKKMFLQPTQTPCCGRTYCNDCITNALIDSDFVCPNCGSEEVLLDDLTPNKDIVEKIKVYESEKEELKKRAQERGEEMENQQVSYTADPATPVSESAKAPVAAPAPNGTTSAQSPTQASAKSPVRSPNSADSETLAAPSDRSTESKKRSATTDEDDGHDERESRSPANAKRPKLDETKSDESQQPRQQQQQQQQNIAVTEERRQSQISSSTNEKAPAPPSQGSTQNLMPTTGPSTQMPQQMPTPNSFASMPYTQAPFGVPFNGMPNFPGMPGMPFPGGPMSMPGFMPGMEAPEGMWNMPNMPNMPFNQPNGSFPNMPSFPNPMMNGFMNGFANNMAPPVSMGENFMNQPPQNNFYQQQNQMGNFANQQRNAYGASSKEEEQPYLRQPVNPHRHQGRQKRLRPTDFREL